MSSNPYKPPTKSSDLKSGFSTSSIVASIFGVVIWLALLVALWIAYEPSIADGEMRIEYDYQSVADPYVFVYVERNFSTWTVAGVVLVALMAIQLLCHCIPRFYKRRHAAQQLTGQESERRLLVNRE